jgi:inner membrane protein
MTARTHDLAAITALGIVISVQPIRSLSLATALIAVLANQIGGILPDIDQPTAPFWRNLPVGHIFGKVVGKSLGGHRFLTHSLFGLAVFGGLTHLLLQFLHPLMHHTDIGLVWWAFMIGMTSHLVMDTFTKEGVPWLLPIPIKFGFPPLKSLRVTTGKAAEKGIFVVMLLFDIWVCANNYPHLLSIIHHISS